VLVHRSCYDEVVEAIGKRVSSIALGDPLGADTQMGPVVTAAQLARVEGFIERALAEGARLVAGGRRPEGEQFARGNWILPTVFADVAPTSDLFLNEVFGPIMAVTPFDDLDEAIELANRVSYGLTAAIWTNDLRHAMQLATRVRAGYVWINEAGRRYKGTPFGGFNDSGIGREEGLEELFSYTGIKTIHLNYG
jgi:acyl-CoA reductase-like NAD-dependent aldehyde dehydrogenase